MLLSSSILLVIVLLLTIIQSSDSNIIKNIRSKILSLSSLSNNLISISPNPNTDTNTDGKINSNINGMKFIPSMLLFFLSTCQSCEASALNPQVLANTKYYFNHHYCYYNYYL